MKNTIKVTSGEYLYHHLAGAKNYELKPKDGRKSFYGKARVLELGGDKILYSYETPVCKIDAAGAFTRLWRGYSATTMRHINAFVQTFGFPGGGKAWWDSLLEADRTENLEVA